MQEGVLVKVIRCVTISKLVLAGMIVSGVTACGPSTGNAQSDIDEMTGLRGDEVVTHGGVPAMGPGEPWTQGPNNQAVGFYAKGSLTGAEPMPVEGPGFRLANPANANHFGTYDLVTIVSSAAQQVQSLVPHGDPLRIGDFSRLKGGRLSGHASHQNGLDGDLAYYRLDGRTHDNLSMMFFGAPLVRAGRVLSQFDFQRNYELVRGLVASGRVVRIFVNPVIKRGFCKYAQSLGENIKQNDLLRVLTPYAGHADHMHVRISCPLKSPKCVVQLPPGAATGC